MSNIAQLQLRYHTVDTLSDLKALVHAFAGDMCLCIANRVLYQYVDYGNGILPDDDGYSVIETNDSSLTTRWVAIDSYTQKSLSGTFTAEINANNWHRGNECFEYTIPVVNPVNNLTCTVFDAANKVVIPQDIFITKDSDAITSVKITVGMYPDCRFAGSYFIVKDKMSF